MGYSNTNKLTILRYPSFGEAVLLCEKCNHETSVTGDLFCSKCGNQLVGLTRYLDMKDIIPKFRDYSEFASMCIDNEGKPEESFSQTIVDDLVKFSLEYPDGVFQVDITWDQGFDAPPTRYYIQNGKQHSCEAKFQFESFDVKKLK